MFTSGCFLKGYSDIKKAFVWLFLYWINTNNTRTIIKLFKSTVGTKAKLIFLNLSTKTKISEKKMKMSNVFKCVPLSLLIIIMTPRLKSQCHDYGTRLKRQYHDYDTEVKEAVSQFFSFFMFCWNISTPRCDRGVEISKMLTVHSYNYRPWSISRKNNSL